MIQRRLGELLDDKIVPFQYGFRQKRSASQAVFVVRRAREAAEREGRTLFQLAWDYSKAFDCIPHEVLIETLKGYGVPAGLLGMVTAIYRTPLFRVRLREHTSESHPQLVGIRQGCLLSPYLFVLITRRLFTTVLENTRGGALEFSQLRSITLFCLYADDNFLMTTTGADMNTLVRVVVEESTKFNLTLNPSKCFLLVTNDNGFRVKFPSGEVVKRKATMKYLGRLFTSTLDVKHILQQRMRVAMTEMNKNSSCSGKKLM